MKRMREVGRRRGGEGGGCMRAKEFATYISPMNNNNVCTGTLHMHGKDVTVSPL